MRTIGLILAGWMLACRGKGRYRSGRELVFYTQYIFQRFEEKCFEAAQTLQLLQSLNRKLAPSAIFLIIEALLSAIESNLSHASLFGALTRLRQRGKKLVIHTFNFRWLNRAFPSTQFTSQTGEMESIKTRKSASRYLSLIKGFLTSRQLP